MLKFNIKERRNMLEKRCVLLILVCVLFFSCSCAKKKAVLVYPTGTSNQSQTSGSGSDASSPEVMPPPIEMPVNQTSSMQDMHGITSGTKQFEQEDIYFEFDQFFITPEGKKILTSKAAFLKANPTIKTRIEGHCDERGTTEYNLALGEKRAEEAMKYLTALGIEKPRLSAISYGKEKPAVQGHNETAWAKNRRVHLDILKN
jgi:peptidoglycan-associated lipoprotein